MQLLPRLVKWYMDDSGRMGCFIGFGFSPDTNDTSLPRPIMFAFSPSLRDAYSSCSYALA